MNAFLLIFPLIFIRFFLLRFLNKDAEQYANQFVPTMGKERIAVVIYQVCSVFLFFFPLFCEIKIRNPYFGIGLLIYLFGIIILLLTTIKFSKVSFGKPLSSGLYNLVRHPMYIGYDLYFLGCVFITQSIPLLMVTIVFVLSSDFLISSEERYCLKTYGKVYEEYMEKVKRYGLF